MNPSVNRNSPPEFFALSNHLIEPTLTQIEISSTLQIPQFQIIGLPSREIFEAKDRVKSSILSAGYEFPNRKVVINLAPASIHKSGSGYDLAIALSILFLQRSLLDPSLGVEKIAAWGELGLGGEVKSVGQMTRFLGAALEKQVSLIALSRGDLERLREALLYFEGQIHSLKILALDHLSELKTLKPVLATELLSPNKQSVVPATRPPAQPLAPSPEILKSILVSLTGHHHVLFLGARGVGKSQALEWYKFLPPDEIDNSRLTQKYLEELRDPMNAMHSLENPFTHRVGAQVKASALVGSYQGSRLTPGVFSVAHGGVLLADEYPEWARDSKESLREPLERGKITLTRVQGNTELPADFLFVGNGNLCACGGEYERNPSQSAQSAPCVCTESQRRSYLGRLTGPVLDRIDICTQIKFRELTEFEADVHALVEKIQDAREALKTRWGKLPGRLTGAEIEALLRETPKDKAALQGIQTSSLRDRHKIYRLALTLSALNKKPSDDAWTLQEARSLRSLTQMPS